MGKILCFIYNDMADFEMVLPGTVIGWLEKELVTIGYENDVVISKPGFKYLPHATVREALEFNDVEGLIIPGGWNNEQRPELTELIQKLNRENKMMAAICAAPQFLVKSGVLNDKKYTTTITSEYLKTQGIEDFFPRKNFVNKNVVRDKNIITGIGRAFVDFAMEIVDFFGGFDDPESKVDKETYSKHFKGL